VNRESIEHEPVLCEPVLRMIAPRPGEIVVDATLGHGGHSRMLAGAVGPQGRLIALDVDERNIVRARDRLPGVASRPPGPRLDLVRANFAELDAVLDDLKIPRVNVILADLGPSTDQLLDASMGLGFAQDGPLDMRLDDRLETTAADLVNRLSETQLSDLIWTLSQERFSRRIARRIVAARREGRIRRTSELVRIISSATGVPPHGRAGRLHPATRTFLALRMAVNHELDNLKRLLSIAAERLAPGGRIGVISFHSGEDRVVKQDFLDRQRAGVYFLRNRKPVTASSEERTRNPRSRSAKLRVAERVVPPDAPPV